MATPSDRPAAVLVLGNIPRVVIPIARSLHARGLVVHVASVVSSRPIRSRAIRSFHSLAPLHDAAEFRRELLAIVERFRVGSIFPTGDDILQALAPIYEELKEHLVFCCPPPAVYDKVLRKEVALAVAGGIGIPVPLTYEMPNIASLREQKKRIGFPVFAKARGYKYHAITGIRAARFDSYAELESLFERFPLFGRWFLIQEYLPGEGVGLDVLMSKGEAVMIFQHRRVRELPFTGGVSVAAENECVDPVLARYAVALLRALAWRGVAMVEFRRDPASGRTELMEVNGRFWGSVALSIQAGFDFPFHAWEEAHGIDPVIVESACGKARFRWLLGDTRRLVDVMKSSAGRGRSVTWAAGQIATYFRDFLPPARDPLWSWSDPRPLLDEGRELLDLVVVTPIAAGLRAVLPQWIRKLRKTCRQTTATGATDRS